MPIYEGQIPNLANTVSKPIAIQAAYHIRNNFFTDTTAPIVVIDHTGTALEIGSDISGHNAVKLDTDSVIQVRYTEIPEPDIFLTAIVDSSEQLPVWLDKDLQFAVRPIKATTSVNMTITYRGNTKSAIDSWVSYLYTKFARGSSSLPMKLRYEAAIPEGIIVLLKSVYDARESRAGYGDSFLDYVTNNFKFPFDIKVNQIGHGKTLVMRDELCNVVARIEPTIPEATREDNNMYSVDIQFNFRYDKPIAMTANYPIFVHNSYINPDFFDTKLDRNKVEKYQKPSDFELINNLSYLYDKLHHAALTIDGLIYPAFDTFTPTRDKPILPLIQLQLVVDDDDPNTLLDLNTLSSVLGLDIHRDLVPYLTKVGNRCFKYGACAVWLSVYRNDTRLSPDSYSVNSSGIVVSNYPLDPRGNYHLTIAITKDLGLMGMSGYEDFVQYGELTHAIISMICPKLPIEHYPRLIDDGIRPYTTSHQLRETVYKLPSYHAVMDSRKHTYTVNSIIITR